MPAALRTATPSGDWRSVGFTALAALTGIKDAVAAGTSFLYLVGDSVMAILESVAIGERAVGIYHAEKIMVPKTAQHVFSVGDRVWWDPATRLVTDTQAKTAYLIGMATEPGAAADEYVEIDLDGASALLGDELD